MSRVYRVVASPDLMPDDRDFGVQLKSQNGEVVLLVPQKLLPLLVDRVIERSDMFYALVLTDPRAVAKQLNWTIHQVAKSLKGLGEILRRTSAPRKTG